MKSSWIKYDTVLSTNTTLAALVIQQQLNEGVVVIAEYQDGGRGHSEHSWLSQKGENLLMSLLLYPAFLSASEQFQLSRVASLALCDTLVELGADPLIKWPNDILTGKGKIAGLLIEHSIISGRIVHSIIGIGLNVNQREFPRFRVPATSLYLERGIKARVDVVGEMVGTSLMSRYRQLKEGQQAKLEKAYMERLFKAGSNALFKCGEELFEGMIRGVTDFGELIVETKGDLRTFGYGSINLLPDYD